MQLARRLPQLRRHIFNAVRANDDVVAHLVLGGQWRPLVLKPFAQLGDAALDPPLVLAVDALDKCHDAAEINVLLRLLCDMPSGMAG